MALPAELIIVNNMIYSVSYICARERCMGASTSGAGNRLQVARSGDATLQPAPRRAIGLAPFTPMRTVCLSEGLHAKTSDTAFHAADAARPCSAAKPRPASLSQHAPRSTLWPCSPCQARTAPHERRPHHRPVAPRHPTAVAGAHACLFIHSIPHPPRSFPLSLGHRSALF